MKSAVSHVHRTTAQAVIEPHQIDRIRVTAHHRLGLVHLKHELKHTRSRAAQTKGGADTASKHFHELGIVFFRHLSNDGCARDFARQWVDQILLQTATDEAPFYLHGLTFHEWIHVRAVLQRTQRGAETSSRNARLSFSRRCAF